MAMSVAVIVAVAVARIRVRAGELGLDGLALEIMTVGMRRPTLVVVCSVLFRAIHVHFMGCLWDAHGLPTGYPWVTNRLPMGHQ